MSMVEGINKNNDSAPDIVVFRDTLINLMSSLWRGVSRPTISKKIRDCFDKNITRIPFENITDLLVSQQKEDFYLMKNLSYYNKDIQLIIWGMIKEHYADTKIFDPKEKKYIDARLWFFKESLLFRAKIAPSIIEDVISIDFNVLFSLKAENNYSGLLEEISLIQKLFTHFVDLQFILKYKDKINQQPESFKKALVSFIVKMHAGYSVSGTKNQMVVLEMLLSIENWHLLNKKALPEVIKFAGQCYMSKNVNKKIEMLLYHSLTGNMFIYMDHFDIKLEELCLKHKYLPSKRIIELCKSYQGLKKEEEWEDLFKLMTFLKKNSSLPGNKVAVVFDYMKDMHNDFFLNIIRTDIFRLMFDDKTSYNAGEEFLKALEVHYFICREQTILSNVANNSSNSLEKKERL